MSFSEFLIITKKLIQKRVTNKNKLKQIKKRDLLNGLMNSILWVINIRKLKNEVITYWKVGLFSSPLLYLGQKITSF